MPIIHVDGSYGVHLLRFDRGFHFQARIVQRTVFVVNVRHAT